MYGIEPVFLIAGAAGGALCGLLCGVVAVLAVYKIFFARGDVATASTLAPCAESIPDVPATPPSDEWIAEFDALQKAGDVDAAFELLQRIVATSPNDATAWHRMGHFHTGRHDFDEATAAFDKAMALDPDNAEVFAGSARAFNFMQEHERSAASFARASELSPDDEEIAFNTGMSTYECAGLEAAYAAMKQCVDRRPDNARMWHGLGSMCSMHGHYKEALEPLAKALEIEPDNMPIRGDMGMALFFTEDYAGCIDHFRAWVAEEPDALQYQFNLGRALLETGQIDAAFAAFGEVDRIEPQYPPAYLQLGRLYALKGEYQDAAEFLQTARVHVGMYKGQCMLTGDNPGRFDYVELESCFHRARVFIAHMDDLEQGMAHVPTLVEGWEEPTMALDLVRAVRDECADASKAMVVLDVILETFPENEDALALQAELAEA
jgi:tetratricopeptide (TPR) repeat protein